MSTIKQLADAEAERAEAEDPDAEPDPAAEPDAEPAGEPDPDAEPEPEPEPEPAAPTEKAMEAAVVEIERAGDDYTAHVREIQARTPLGLIECPLCPVPGFVTEVPPPDVDQLQRLAVLTALGEAPLAPPPDHPNLHRCEACDGHGLLPTGSRREEFKTQPCPACGGNGYVDSAVMQAQADARAMEAAAAAAGGLPPAPVPMTAGGPTLVTQGGHTFPFIPGGAPDQVGRLAGHPLWGQDAAVGGL